MEKFTFDDILALPAMNRRNLMNSVNGLKTATLIGSKGHRGQTNLGVFNSIVHVGATPPYMGFIIRPLTVPRHTFHNIKATKHFTINHIKESFLEQAHQTSANYPENISEFAATGLTEEFLGEHSAPYVQEASVKIGLSFHEEHRLVNDTIFMIGKVEALYLPDETIADDGFVDMAKAGSLGVAGLDAYYQAKLIERKAYARVRQKEL